MSSVSTRLTEGARYYLPQLDGLRFFAFLLVFVHHVVPPEHAGPLPEIAYRLLQRVSLEGAYGVDLFLVLSAYLITTLLLLERKKHGSMSLRDFYIRRSLRIWPLYFLAVFVGFLAFPLFQNTFGEPFHTKLVQEHLAAYLVFLGNYSAGLFGYAESRFLAHLWTISLEEQFYLLWPLVLVLLARTKTSLYWVLFALLVLTVFLRLGCAFAPVRHPFVWTNLLTRLDPLILGSWLALRGFDVAPNNRSRLRFTVQLFAGFGLLALPGFFQSLDTHSIHITWQYSAIALGFGLILDSAVASRESLLARFLSLPPLVWLGKLCYGLYVFHLFGILLSHLLAQDLGLSPGGYTEYAFNLVFGFSLTTGIAYLSYEYFERRFLKLKERFTRIRSRPA